jgi:hypothetical protein
MCGFHLPKFPHRKIGSPLTYERANCLFCTREGAVPLDVITPFGWLRWVDFEKGLTKTDYDDLRPPTSITLKRKYLR